MSAKLPTGPPKIMVEVKFTPREIEFIELRYGQGKIFKEIQELWGVSERVVKFHSSSIVSKIGLYRPLGEGECGATLAIQVTKRLINLGFITTEEK